MDITQLNPRMFYVLIAFCVTQGAAWILKQFGVEIPGEVTYSVSAILFALFLRWSKIVFLSPEEKALFETYLRERDQLRKATDPDKY